MATIFKLTITIGKGEAAHEREISIDPDEMPMGILEDLDALGSAKDWKSIRPIICELFGLTQDEFRAMTTKQFIEISTALSGAVGAATSIPNA
jgi:hypothetical protein